MARTYRRRPSRRAGLASHLRSTRLRSTRLLMLPPRRLPRRLPLFRPGPRHLHPTPWQRTAQLPHHQPPPHHLPRRPNQWRCRYTFSTASPPSRWRA